MNKNMRGFTLAEVLITLGIIGIVAAMTMPSLIQKQQEKETVVKLKKFHSTLSQAFVSAVNENQTADNWDASKSSQGASNAFNILFKPYFKISKDCGVDNAGGCIPNVAYKLLSGIDTTNYASIDQYYKFRLADGAAIWLRGNDTVGFHVDIFYDVNGDKGPNQWGIDLFEFYINKDKLYANGLSETIRPFETSCLGGRNGYGCSSWVIYNENMDYLHCDDLSWDGKKSCKEKK